MTPNDIENLSPDLDRIFRQAAAGSVVPPAPAELDARLQRLYAAADDHQSTPRVPVFRPSGVRASRIAVWLSAAALAIAGVFFAAHKSNRPSSQVASTVYATAVGERVTIPMTDGSRVTLAPGSRLALRPGFGKAHRDVELQGEAFFDVESSSGRPFVVRTGSVTTRVLGTTFTVRHYASDSAAQVAVLSGKVAIGNRTSSTVTAGMAALVTDSTIQTSHLEDPDVYVGWKSGRLVFKNQPVQSVLTTLGRWYGYQFRLEDSTIASRHVTTEVMVERREETLSALKSLLKVSMVFRDSVVTLVPRESVQKSKSHIRDTPSPFNEVGR